jgi:hypothetical protein
MAKFTMMEVEAILNRLAGEKAEAVPARGAVSAAGARDAYTAT